MFTKFKILFKSDKSNRHCMKIYYYMKPKWNMNFMSDTVFLKFFEFSTKLNVEIRKNNSYVIHIFANL